MLHTPAHHKIGDIATQALAPAVTLALLAVLLVMLSIAVQSPSNESDPEPSPPIERAITQPWI